MPSGAMCSSIVELPLSSLAFLLNGKLGTWKIGNEWNPFAQEVEIAPWKLIGATHKYLIGIKPFYNELEVRGS